MATKVKNKLNCCLECLYRVFKCKEEPDDSNSNDVKVNVIKSSAKKIKTKSSTVLSRDSPPAKKEEELVDDNDIIQIKRNTKNFQINSEISYNKIKCTNEYQGRKSESKFNCLICLKFFNYILESQCCFNHICRNCAEDYLSTTLKYSTKIKCPLCSQEEKVILVDYDPSKPPKYYIDDVKSNMSKKKETNKNEEVELIKEGNSREKEPSLIILKKIGYDDEGKNFESNNKIE